MYPLVNKSPSAASYRKWVKPWVILSLPWTYGKIKESDVHFFKTPPRQKQNNGGGKNKSQTSKHAFVFQNVNHAAAKQTYFTLWLAAEPKQVMCLVAYVCPQDKLIRLSPQPCFILDEFLILLPGKSTASSQANTIHVPHISLSDKLLKL